MWRYIQKKFILPLVWAVKREKIIRDMKIRSSDEIYEKIEEIRDKIVVLQRNGDDVQVARQRAVLDNLLWITYDSAEF